jgi:phenylacetate-CoA ligase
MISASARDRMTALAMAAYSRAPTWMQNLLISAYGMRLLRLRYGRTGRETLAWLSESQWMDSADVRGHQLSALSEVVARAAADVPFYRRRGLEGIDFDSLEQLQELPLLTKSEVQRAGRDMISDLHRRRKLTEVHTGGTTGKPLAIYCDSETLQRNYAFFSRFKSWAGVSAGARVATFAGRTLIPAGGGEP